MQRKPKSKYISLLTLLLIVSVLLACKMLSKSNMFEGTEMQDAVAAFKKKIDGPIKALSLTIEKDSATLRAQDPKNLQHVDEYKYVKGLVVGPTPVQLNLLERNLDKTLFNLDEVNLAATPALAKAAVERTKLEGGKVAKMEIERSLNLSAVFDKSSNDLIKSGGVQWRVSVQGTRENASVVANMKGDITGVDLSQTAQAASVNYYDGDAMSKAAAQIKEAFGGRVKLIELIIYPKYVWFQAQDPQKPDEFNQYKCDINGVSRSRAIDLRSTLGPKSWNLTAKDFLFDLDEVNFAKTPELAKAALDKLQIDGGHLTLMKLSRGSWGTIRDDKEIKWDVSISGARQKSGYVIYDAQGNQKSVKPAE
jgi:hypothetical protein